MSYRRPTCPGQRQAPTETKQADPSEWRVWARRYGLGKCPVCEQWMALHKDGTLVAHADRCIRCGSTDVRTFNPSYCGFCYVLSSRSED